MKSISAKAPINIALIKYWGKEDESRVIPYNSSLSITLDNLFTVTTIEESKTGFSFTLNNNILKGKEEKRVYDFLKHYTTPKEINKVRVKSTNFVPTAAGLASSASAFAALSVAANEYFKTNFSFDKLALVTRLGSGSACRSLLGGFVAWEKDGRVYKVDSKVSNFILISVIIDSKSKKISSRGAMAKSVKTSPMYSFYVEESKKDFVDMKEAIENGDIIKIGNLTRKSFSMMHAVMLSTIPPILYMQDRSLAVIELADTLVLNGIYCYPTMDAGANVKLLTTKEDYEKVVLALEENGFIDYYISRLGQGATIIDE
ncbi:MAG: diphosphomevalonate decarboxylase [Bacilli bacterium]